jgi:glycosyltransferase involved in cell wall biosynthesis
MKRKIPVTVIITTKNESKRIEKCIVAMKEFDQIIVVDSNSTDDTRDLARARGAQIVNFQWNGRYPKKRQWCLDNLGSLILNDWVFFVDADEILTPEIISELAQMDWTQNTKIVGYFVKGRYIFEGFPLQYGLQNNKLALLNRHKMHFPVVDDLGVEGMGEIEGHYQPVIKDEFAGHMIGQIKAPLLHDACDNLSAWHERHKRYALWEQGMDERNAWPAEASHKRTRAKRIFRALSPKARGFAAFCHSYLYRMGFLDGVRGYRFARLRAEYYANR